jgi:hypothetical protein
MKETIKTMADTNEKDKQTMGMLKVQTDILHSTNDKLNEANGYIDRSENIVRNLLKKVFTNKLILFALIILLVIINLFLLYVKLKYKLLRFN